MDLLFICFALYLLNGKYAAVPVFCPNSQCIHSRSSVRYTIILFICGKSIHTAGALGHSASITSLFKLMCVAGRAKSVVEIFAYLRLQL